MRIDITVYDGFDEMDALGPLEVLRSAERSGAGFSTRLVTRGPQDQVTTQHGVRLVPDGVFETGADLILVPGGGWANRAEVGTWGEVQRADWLPLLGRAAAAGTVMAGVCTGVMLLAHAGVVGARRATTHHSAWDDLAATGTLLVKERVVDDGDLLTAGGVTSGIDLALWIVERFASRALADLGAERIEYARARPSTVAA